MGQGEGFPLLQLPQVGPQGSSLPKQDLPGEQGTKLLTTALMHWENRHERGPEPGL